MKRRYALDVVLSTRTLRDDELVLKYIYSLYIISERGRGGELRSAILGQQIPISMSVERMSFHLKDP